MIRFIEKISMRQRSFIAVLAIIFSTSAVAAASSHRFIATMGTGSEGAFTYNNTSPTGSAIEGTVATTADTSITLPFGVLGEYATGTTQFGIGVAGISTTGYGVAAEALGVNQAVYAENLGTGQGIYSVSLGQAYSIEGVSDYNVPSAMPSGSMGGTGVLGAPSGEGAIGFGYSGNSLDPALSAVAEIANTDLIAAYQGPTAAPSSTPGRGIETFIVQYASVNRSAVSSPSAAKYRSDVQVSGDMYLYGKVYQNCSVFPATTTTTCDDVTASNTATFNGIVRDKNDTKFSAYTSKQSVPSVEDVGNGHLQGGIAYIRLESTFANVISPSMLYHVFLTPNGDSKGLYVTQKSMNGFLVRESAGGHANVDFDYRIVASPLGDNGTRFPRVTVRKKPDMIYDGSKSSFFAWQQKLNARKHERDLSFRRLTKL